MKKLGIAVLCCFVLLTGATGAWAYTTSLMTVLTDVIGSVEMTANIWSPADSSSPTFGSGLWQYNYTVKNLDYDTFMSTFEIDLPDSPPLSNFTTPSYWTLFNYGTSVKWVSDSAYELYTGDSMSGFGFESPYEPRIVSSSGWQGTLPEATGCTLGPGTVPEPASALMLALGLFGFGVRARRKFIA